MHCPEAVTCRLPIPGTSGSSSVPTSSTLRSCDSSPSRWLYEGTAEELHHVGLHRGRDGVRRAVTRRYDTLGEMVNPSTAHARVVVDELIRGGVRDVVLCPGSRNAPLAFALSAADAAG